MTSSNGTIFRVTGPLCGDFTGHRWISPQRPVTRSFDVCFDQRLNKRLSKQSRCRWFETPSCSLWRHCNGPNEAPPDMISVSLVLFAKFRMSIWRICTICKGRCKRTLTGNPTREVAGMVLQIKSSHQSDSCICLPSRNVMCFSLCKANNSQMVILFPITTISAYENKFWNCLDLVTQA